MYGILKIRHTQKSRHTNGASTQGDERLIELQTKVTMKNHCIRTLVGPAVAKPLQSTGAI